MSSEVIGDKCHFAEIVQYACDLENVGNGKIRMHCFPIPRIFRICQGKPTVEITKALKIDMITGEVELPPESVQLAIRGKKWADVIKYSEIT